MNEDRLTCKTCTCFDGYDRCRFFDVFTTRGDTACDYYELEADLAADNAAGGEG